jgi:hypothetical protein
VFPGNPSYNPTTFIWNPVNGGVPYASGRRGTLPPNLEGRPVRERGYLLGQVRPGHSEGIGREPAWSDLPAHGVGARRDCHGRESRLREEEPWFESIDRVFQVDVHHRVARQRRVVSERQ